MKSPILCLALVLAASGTRSTPGAADEPKPATGNPPAAAWFTATPAGDGVFRIDDHGADNLYLVLGADKALLIDTGLGVADLKKFVGTLTSRAVIVVNTHGHPDHAGGNYQFPEVHAGRGDFALARSFNTKEHRAAAGPMMRGATVPDDQVYRGPAQDTVMVPVAQGFVFDLGGRQLEVIEVPGHTRGGICLLDRRHRLLFSGDNDNPQQWQFLEESTPLETYLRTLSMLQERSAEFDTLLPGHGGSLDRGFLAEQIQAVRNILDGSCAGEPYHTFAGDGRICTYKRAAIVFDPSRLR